jgi:hypothetical protein
MKDIYPDDFFPPPPGNSVSADITFSDTELLDFFRKLDLVQKTGFNYFRITETKYWTDG